MRQSSRWLALAFAASCAIPICIAQTAPAHHAAAKKPAPSAPAKLDITPEVIFFNGVIYTGEGLADDKPQTVEAMAIGGGKVLAVGTSAEITKLAGEHTRLRDINSANSSTYLFPGFNDAHVHSGRRGPHQAEYRSDWREIAGRNAQEDCSLCQRPARRPLAHRWQLGPHAVGPKNAPYAAGSGQGHRRSSRVSRPHRWAHRHRQHCRAQSREYYRRNQAAAGRGDRSRFQWRACRYSARVRAGPGLQGDSAAHA